MTTDPNPQSLLTLEGFERSSLNPVHDQEDEQNRQQAILVGRFYRQLLENGLPESVAEDIVKTRFYAMMTDDLDKECLVEFDMSDFEEDD